MGYYADRRVKSSDRRRELFRVDPHCYYCGIETKEYLGLVMKKGDKFPDDMATLEHLYDKFDYVKRVEAWEKGDKTRHVLACWKCNTHRGLERARTMPKALLEERRKYLLAKGYKLKEETKK